LFDFFLAPVVVVVAEAEVDATGAGGANPISPADSDGSVDPAIAAIAPEVEASIPSMEEMRWVRGEGERRRERGERLS